MLVKLKDKGQVTIPAAVRERVTAQTGDFFAVDVRDGAIVLTPQDLVKRRKGKPKGVDIGQWIGSGKGLFKTPKDADAYIRSERAKWD